jgi:hypothetical protein
MATNYSNLPSKSNTSSESKVIQYFDNYYTKPTELDVGNIDVMRGFFEQRGFQSESAKNITYLILKTAKQSNYTSQEILEALSSYNDQQLNDFLLSILNFNRAKTSTLGSIKKVETTEIIMRNIVA